MSNWIYIDDIEVADKVNTIHCDTRDYDTCVALKELGFNNFVNWYFNEDKSIVSSMARYRNHYIPRVHLYEAQKWLREKKHIDVLVYLDDMKGYFPFIRIWEGTWNTFVSLEESHTNNIEYSKNYESSLLEGIKEAVKILKDETISD